MNAVQTISKMQLNGFIDAVDNNVEAISMECRETHGIKSWFKAYVQTPAFDSLGQDNKSEAFDLYKEFIDFSRKICDLHYSVDTPFFVAPKETKLQIKKLLNEYKLTFQFMHNQGHGVHAWFKAFLKSEDFINLDKIYRAEAFDMYEGLNDFLSNVDPIIEEIYHN